MELNRNAENYFAEIEYAAFSPSNIVPGIGYSPRQDAAGAGLLLRRRASLPARHPLRGDAGQRAPGGGEPLPQGRHDAVLPQRHRQPRRLLRAELLRRPAGGQDRPGAAAAHLGRRDALRPPRSATTTSASRARCSTSSTTARRRGSSPTSPPRWAACRTRSSSGSAGSSTRSTPTTAAASATAVARAKDADPAKAISVTDDTPQHAAE